MSENLQITVLAQLHGPIFSEVEDLAWPIEKLGFRYGPYQEQGYKFTAVWYPNGKGIKENK